MRKFGLAVVISAVAIMFLGASALAGEMLMPKSNTEGELKWNRVDVDEFESADGDYVLANLSRGVGYLANRESKIFTTFPLLSGQHRYVYYVGRYYYAATPEQEWVIKEMNIQRDRFTFSESGRFLRMYANGDTYTSYGIHAHAHFETMIERDSKFQSMGCLLVSDEVMDVLEESFYANENGMRVLTFSS